jgi:hypothetical protein
MEAVGVALNENNLKVLRSHSAFHTVPSVGGILPSVPPAGKRLEPRWPPGESGQWYLEPWHVYQEQHHVKGSIIMGSHLK